MVVGVAGSPYNPQTPGSGLDTGVGSGISGSDWHTTDIEVRIRDSHDDPALAGQQAVIRGISVCNSVYFKHIYKDLDFNYRDINIDLHTRLHSSLIFQNNIFIFDVYRAVCVLFIYLPKTELLI